MHVRRNKYHRNRLLCMHICSELVSPPARTLASSGQKSSGLFLGRASREVGRILQGCGVNELQTMEKKTRQHATKGKRKCYLPSVDLYNLLKRLDCTLPSIFSRAFAFSDLLDFLLSQVESYLHAM